MPCSNKTARVSYRGPCFTEGNHPLGVGWTKEFYFKHGDDTAYFHSLLMTVLVCYYSDLCPAVQYRCTEYRHPMKLHTTRQTYLSLVGMKLGMLAGWKPFTLTLWVVPLWRKVWRMQPMKLVWYTVPDDLRKWRKIHSGFFLVVTLKRRMGDDGAPRSWYDYKGDGPFC